MKNSIATVISTYRTPLDRRPVSVEQWGFLEDSYMKTFTYTYQRQMGHSMSNDPNFQKFPR